MDGYIFCISDTHFDRWIRNNPSLDYRCKTQPIMLACVISERMKEKNSNILVIAGDLVNKWSVEPKVVWVLKRFYEKLIELNPKIKIYYLAAQHDIKNYDDHSEENSFIHLVADQFKDNVEYGHNKWLEIGNTTIYMSNYGRKGPIYPVKHANVWISHIPLGFVEVNEDSFDLLVAGDIHNYYDKGKCHSIMPPYQLHPNEPEQGYIGLITLDGSNSKFERIPSDTEKYKFLRLDKIKKEEQKSQSIVKIDITNTIDEEVKNQGLNDIHALIDKTQAPPPINFNFTLKRIVIDNYRSISHLDLDFTDMGSIIYISGKNGSGKSSIIYAIRDALKYDRKLKYRKNVNSDGELGLKLFIDYEDHEFVIEKDPWSIKFSCDGNEIKLSKKETQKELEQYLPWIPYFDYFYSKAGTHYWEYHNRADLIKVLFNFSTFDYYMNQGNKLYDECEQDLERNKLEFSKSEVEVKTRTENLEKLQTEIDSLKDLGSIDHMRNKLHKLKSNIDRVKQLDSNFEYMDSNIKRQKEKLESYKEYENLNVEETKAEISKLNKEISDASIINKAIVAAESRIKSNESYIKSESARIIKCDKCGNIISKDADEHIKSLEASIKDDKAYLVDHKMVSISENSSRISQLNDALLKYSNLESIKNEINSLEESSANNRIEQSSCKVVIKELLDEYAFTNETELVDKLYSMISQQELRNKLILELDSEKKKVQELESNLINIKLTIENLKTKLESIEKYINLFDMKKKDSIPIKHINALVQKLNTENIKFQAVDEESGKLDITTFIKVGEKWIDYDEASSGQKSMMDLIIILHIVSLIGSQSGAGTLMLDEIFANMDSSKIEESLNLIQNINVGKLIMTSHSDVMSSYDTKIELVLENGITKML